MKRILFFLLLCMSVSTLSAQGFVKGKVLDKQNSEPLGFVNVRITQKASGAFVGGGMTDSEGNFTVKNLKNGAYVLTLTFVGYKEETRDFELTADSPKRTFTRIYMSENRNELAGVTITGQKSTMKLEVDRKSFDVTQLISNSGEAASDVLDNIPSVEVDNDGNVSLRGNSSVEVWINGKSSGLTSDNRAQILQQLPAESIEKIEVIDNPSAKFSAEGSAGIINIVLKKNRKAGYYGSLQAGGGTRGGANTSFNINYNSSKLDAYANIGYRHRSNDGRSESDQVFTNTGEYQRYRGTSKNMGNNLFTRAGITWHATDKDDISFNGMMMLGGGKNRSDIPYRYGTVGDGSDSRMMLRRTRSKDDMRMFYGELNYRHNFSDKHFIDFTIDANKWKRDNDNFYQDSTVYYSEERPTEYDYQYRPMYMNNNRWEMKLDYENQINDRMKVEAGYQGNFSHENSPQESFVDETSWDGANSVEDKDYFNRFIYDMDLHALYATFSYKLGKLGVMGGLRGEYWKVNTESYTWEQEHDASKRDPAFKKDYFQLFPSLFLSYQLTETQQLQLNYTRRLRRPWGGQLNSFRDTRDATMVSFGNPELTPEFSNSFSLNYLKTWNDHSLLVSAYYRPTSDVIQRINYQSSTDGLMYSTSVNVAKSLSSGLEVVLKNKLFRILDLTTTANAYYYKLNGFSYDIDGQTVTGKGNDNFTWNARMTASLILPYDISVQATGRYNARQVITQGHRKANYSVDLGARKNFFNKALTVAVNCRDLLNSRKWVNYTESDTFTRYQMNKRGGRNVNLTVTWNFGNMKAKKKPQKESGMPDYGGQQYGGEGGEM
ncbi:TonB-dependent receptor domain-containing protein [Leyella lascolaii]|uniref:TonB-dependent receptor domain-containing protein n=1 Tax=Leyella lascolaii TaxID=1776379 RepID=UPI002357ACDA|nr:TonB-dependent receptor [Leyella lascolaii]